MAKASSPETSHFSDDGSDGTVDDPFATRRNAPKIADSAVAFEGSEKFRLDSSPGLVSKTGWVDSNNPLDEAARLSQLIDQISHLPMSAHNGPSALIYDYYLAFFHANRTEAADLCRALVCATVSKSRRGLRRRRHQAHSSLSGSSTDPLAVVRRWVKCLEELETGLRLSLPVSRTGGGKSPLTTGPTTPLPDSRASLRSMAVAPSQGEERRKASGGKDEDDSTYDIAVALTRVGMEIDDLDELLRLGEAGVRPGRTVREITISARGDALLEFANLAGDCSLLGDYAAEEESSEDPVLRFRVSSLVLAEVSPLFARIFGLAGRPRSAGQSKQEAVITGEAEGQSWMRWGGRFVDAWWDEGDGDSSGCWMDNGYTRADGYGFEDGDGDDEEDYGNKVGKNTQNGDDPDSELDDDLEILLPMLPAYRHRVAGTNGQATVVVYRMRQHELDAHNALSIVLHAAHMHSDRVPRSVPFAALVAAARAALRYRCAAPLDAIVEHRWLPAWVHRATDPMPAGLLLVSLAFGLRQLFTRTSKTAILNLRDYDELRALPWPRAVRERLWAVRTAKMDQVRACIVAAVQEFLPRPSDPPVLFTPGSASGSPSMSSMPSTTTHQLTLASSLGFGRSGSRPTSDATLAAVVPSPTTTRHLSTSVASLPSTPTDSDFESDTGGGISSSATVTGSSARRRRTSMLGAASTTDARPLVPSGASRCPKGSHWCDATNLGWLLLVFGELQFLPFVMAPDTMVPPPLPQEELPPLPPAPLPLSTPLPSPSTAVTATASATTTAPLSPLALSRQHTRASNSRFSLTATRLHSSNPNPQPPRFSTLPPPQPPRRSLSDMFDALRRVPSPPHPVHGAGGVCDPTPLLRAAVNDISNSVFGLTLQDVRAWAIAARGRFHTRTRPRAHLRSEAQPRTPAGQFVNSSGSRTCSLHHCEDGPGGHQIKVAQISRTLVLEQPEPPVMANLELDIGLPLDTAAPDPELLLSGSPLTLPDPLVARILEAADTLEDLLSLSATCRAFHTVFLRHELRLMRRFALATKGLLLPLPLPPAPNLPAFARDPSPTSHEPFRRPSARKLKKPPDRDRDRDGAAAEKFLAGDPTLASDCRKSLAVTGEKQLREAYERRVGVAAYLGSAVRGFGISGLGGLGKS